MVGTFRFSIWSLEGVTAALSVIPGQSKQRSEIVVMYVTARTAAPCFSYHIFSAMVQPLWLRCFACTRNHM